MCSPIAARITSDSGSDSTLATISKASACSVLRRMLIVLTGFMLRLCTKIPRLSSTVVVWYTGITNPRRYAMSKGQSEGQPAEGHHEHEFHIQIDRVHFTTD